MSTGSVHEELRDDLAAYALGALDRDEAAAVADHLAGCEACRNYVRWLQPAVELLPASVVPVEPPSGLGERLMATVRAEAAEAHEAEPAGTPPATTRRRWRSWRGLMLRPATVLAAIAVLATGLALGYALGGAGDDRTEVTAEPTGELPAGAIAATLEHGAGGDAILHVERMPALDRDRVYEAWASSDEGVVALASFRPRADGSTEVVLPGSLEGASEVLVTEEPRDVGNGPTTPPVLRATLG